MVNLPPDGSIRSSTPEVRVIQDPKDKSKIAVLVTENGVQYRVSYLRIKGQLIDLTDPKYAHFAEELKDLGHVLLNKPPQGSQPHNVSVRVAGSALKMKGLDDNSSSVDGSRRLKAKEQAAINELIKQAEPTLKLLKRAENVEARFEPKASRLYKMARKAAAFVTVVVTAPVALLVIGIARTVHNIRRVLTRSPQNQKIREAMKSLRKEGSKTKYTTLKTALDVTPEVAKTQFETIKHSMTDIATAQKQFIEKITDTVRASLIAGGYTKQEALKELQTIEFALHNVPSDQIKTWEDFQKVWTTIAGGTPAMVSVTQKELKEIYEETRLLRMDPEERNAALAQDLELWQSFVELNTRDLDPNNTDYRRLNSEVIFVYRRLVNTPTYLAFKNDPNNEFVKNVHKFAVAIETRTKVEDTYFDLYYRLGEALLEGQDTSNMTTAEIVDLGMRVSQSGLYSADSKFKDFGEYRPMNLRLTLGSLASQGGFRADMAYILGAEPYDPHGALGNNPSLQGITEMEVEGQAPFRIFNSYGGSATVGSKVAPEKIALLQAMRNNKKLDEHERDPEIPAAYVFMNNQNIENTKGEGERSFALMQLQEKFPEEFMGATLSKDSDLYVGKGKYASLPWTGVEEFGQHYIQCMSNDACYRATGRKGDKSGYGMLFPGGKELWVGADGLLRKIVEEANVMYRDKFAATNDPKTAKEYRTTYQNFIYAQIRSYSEIIKALEESGSVISSERCKECKDRGGGANTKLIYTRMDESDPNKNVALVGATVARSVDVGNVPPLSHRINPINLFIKHTPFEQFQERTMSFFEKCGIEIKKRVFQPALSRKVEVINIPAPVVPAPIEGIEDEEEGLEEVAVTTKFNGQEVKIEGNVVVFGDRRKAMTFYPLTIENWENPNLVSIDKKFLVGRNEMNELMKPLYQEQIAQLFHETVDAKTQLIKAKDEVAAVGDEAPTVRDEAAAYNKLLENKVPASYGTEDVVLQFKNDFVRGCRLQIDGGEVYPNGALLAQNTAENRMTQAFYALAKAVGNEDAWFDALQAVVCQHTLTTFGLKAAFSAAAIDKEIGLSSEGVSLFQTDITQHVNGLDVYPPVQLNINRDANGAIIDVRVSVELPHDVLDQAGNVIVKDLATAYGSFTVTLDDEGKIVVKDFYEAVESPLIVTQEAQLKEGMETYLSELKTTTKTEPVKEVWNNRNVLFEDLGGGTQIVSLQKLDGQFSQREIKFYEEDPSYTQKEHGGFVSIGEYYVDKKGWDELVREVTTLDQAKPLPGTLMATGLSYQGFSVNIYAKENPVGKDSFQGAVVLYKDGVRCGEIEVDKVKQHKPKLGESRDTTVEFTSGDHDYYVKKKYLDAAIKKIVSP